MVEPKTARPGGGRAEALSTLTRTTCSVERSRRARYSAAQERRSSRAYSAAKARVRVEHMRRQRADAAVPKIANVGELFTPPSSGSKKTRRRASESVHCSCLRAHRRSRR
jgi:hypothetical protein